jgi:anthranilate phosphoribosyltransferase
VLLNAGAALYIAGKVQALEAGIALAAEMLDSKKAYEKLEQFIQYSNEEGREENAAE